MSEKKNDQLPEQEERNLQTPPPVPMEGDLEAHGEADQECDNEEQRENDLENAGAAKNASEGALRTPRKISQIRFSIERPALPPRTPAVARYQRMRHGRRLLPLTSRTSPFGSYSTGNIVDSATVDRLDKAHPEHPSDRKKSSETKEMSKPEEGEGVEPNTEEVPEQNPEEKHPDNDESA